MSRRFRFLFSALLLIAAGCTSTPPPPDVDLTPHTQRAVKTLPPPTPKSVSTNHLPVIVVKPVVVAKPPPPPPHIEHAPPFKDTWISLERWCQTNGFMPLHRTVTDSVIAYTFNLPGGTATVRIGSTLATWRGMQLYLGFAPELVGGKPCMHLIDVKKNFEPLLEPPDHFEMGKVIMIDPGHGGAEPGTRSVFNNHYEKEYTLDWARRIQSILVSNGWTVRLTRTSDVEIAVSNRSAFAEEHKPDFFLSLHFNSAFPDKSMESHENFKSVEGLETFCLTPHGMPSNETRGYRDDPSRLLPNNRFDSENLRYAARLQRALLKVNGHLDRGVRHARFMGVLQNQNRPAVLIEGGYLSNPAEARRIADPAYRERLAEAVAKALEEAVAEEHEKPATPAINPTNKTDFRTAEHSAKPQEKTE